jgi:hypothetical protein
MGVALAFVIALVGMVCPSAAASPFDGLCATASAPCVAGPYFTIVSAFPAEGRMLRAAIEVSERLSSRACRCPPWTRSRLGTFRPDAL